MEVIVSFLLDKRRGKYKKKIELFKLELELYI